jgi:hypothetical protein
MRLLSVLPRIGILAILFAVAVPPAPAPAQVSIGVGVAINIGPPPIPVYVPPPVPQPNLIWTPGYWQYGPYGYFWVPGAWVPAPYPGYLWTPGYWGYGGGRYAWHAGYWGPHVGFYGGVNYGAGYFGVGFVGGQWAGGAFRYNTAVYNNINTTIIHNTYINKTVINNNYYTRSRTSYYGGPGGLTRPPLPNETAYSHETHVPATPIQRQHVQNARLDRNNLASVNKGSPLTPAVARPLTKENRPTTFAPVKESDKMGGANGDYRANHPQYDENHPVKPAGQNPPHHNSMQGEQNQTHHAQGNGGGHKVQNPPSEAKQHPQNEEHPKEEHKPPR